MPGMYGKDRREVPKREWTQRRSERVRKGRLEKSTKDTKKGL